MAETTIVAAWMATRPTPRLVSLETCTTVSRAPLHRALVWGIGATLLLPILLAVILGLGGLLGGLGDAAGARVCLRAGMVVGVVWLTSVVATVAVTAMAVVGGRPPRHFGRKRRRRRVRRRDGHLREESPDQPMDRGLS